MDSLKDKQIGTVNLRDFYVWDSIKDQIRLLIENGLDSGCDRESFYLVLYSEAEEEENV